MKDVWPSVRWAFSNRPRWSFAACHAWCVLVWKAHWLRTWKANPSWCSSLISAPSSSSPLQNCKCENNNNKIPPTIWAWSCWEQPLVKLTVEHMRLNLPLKLPPTHRKSEVLVRCRWKLLARVPARKEQPWPWTGVPTFPHIVEYSSFWIPFDIYECFVGKVLCSHPQCHIFELRVEPWDQQILRNAIVLAKAASTI